MANENETPIRVGLLGAGTVGSQTARLIVEQKDELTARIGRPIELTGVACLDPAETDPFPWIDKSIVTTDTMSVATNSDIVIELIGGTGVARKFVLAAIYSCLVVILILIESLKICSTFVVLKNGYTESLDDGKDNALIACEALDCDFIIDSDGAVKKEELENH